MKLAITAFILLGLQAALARADGGAPGAHPLPCRSGGANPVHTSLQDLLQVDGVVAQQFLAWDASHPSSGGPQASQGALERVRIWRSGAGPYAHYFVELVPRRPGEPYSAVEGGWSSDDSLSGSGSFGNFLHTQAAIEVSPERIHLVHQADVRMLRIRLGSRMQLVGYADISLRALATGGGYAVASGTLGAGVAWETSDEQAAYNQQHHRPRFRISLTGGTGGAGSTGVPRLELAGEIMTAAELSF